MSTDKKFAVDYAKRPAKCKKCGQQITKGELRMAKLVPNIFLKDVDNPPDMKQYHHANCLFETLERCRPTTKVIESTDDINGWSDVKEEDRSSIIEMIENLSKLRSAKKAPDKDPKRRKSNVETNKSNDDSKKTPKKETDNKTKQLQPTEKKSFDKEEAKKQRRITDKRNDKSSKNADSHEEVDVEQQSSSASAVHKHSEHDKDKKRPEKRKLVKEVDECNEKRTDDGDRDQPNEKKSKRKSVDEKNESEMKKRSKFDSFKLFCKLCDVISTVPKYSDKSTAVNLFINKEGYDGDVLLLMRMLIPSTDQRVYNLKEKQLIKLFSYIFDWSVDEVTSAYNQSGDISATLRHYFEKCIENNRKSQLSLHDIDKWLSKLTDYTKEDEQQKHLKYLANRVTPVELQYVIRLIMKDLRINAGAKHILAGLKEGAYDAFQSCRDLKAVVEKCRLADSESLPMVIASGIDLGTPVKPMLAEVCRNVEHAMKRCVNGMYSEIKYDGERLQLHKSGDSFSYFSRSLKSVSDHKVSHLCDYIPKAFPKGGDMILDAEVLMVNLTTGKPLPFGTLGIHKKNTFADAVVCIFIFDCLLFNGRSLVDRPLKERKKILEENIEEIPNRVLLSNYQLIEHGDHAKLKTMIWKAIDEGLEGLVLKDVESVYEPGKRHWLKMKKDYLEDGKMADTADLIVLGAYYGTGYNGGLMSVFLMGVYDEASDKFLTVTKCGNGHTDEAIEQINKQLRAKMREIRRDYDYLPAWIECSRALVPDFIIDDPKEAPVWEITGAEFSRSDKHTARGISIRFPRVTKIRDDKCWSTATNMNELENLFEQSKTKTDFDCSMVDAVSLYAKNNAVDAFGNCALLNAEGGDTATNQITSSPVQRDGNGTDEEDTCTKNASNPSEDDSDERIDNKDESGMKRKRVDKRKDEHSSRKLSDEVATSSDTNAKRNDTKDSDPPKKIVCKYGKDCYRKSADHRRKYFHPL